MDIAMRIFQLLFSLSILVFIHELGHYSMARFFGARVEKFYLFFNPWFSIFKWKSKRSGTVYGLGWLPLGGYCQIAGMIDESLDTEAMASEPKPDEFRSKKPFARLMIMAGGVIFNVILAFIIYTGITLAWGTKVLHSDQVSAGMNFSTPAEEVGFVDGDVILSVDGKQSPNVLDSRFMSSLINAHEVVVRRGGAVETIRLPEDMMQRLLRAEEGFGSLRMPFVVDAVSEGSRAQGHLVSGDRVVAVDSITCTDVTEVITALDKKKGKDVVLTVERSGTALQTMLPVDTAGHIGVVLKGIEELYPIEHVHYNVFTAIPAGIDRAGQTISGYVRGLKYMFTKEGAKQMGGLGTMGKLFPTTFDWQSFWSITAFLSIILAVMNILPIPALDGGHILFIIIEMIRRKPLSDKAMTTIQTIGLVLLVLLMVYANGNDIYRAFFGK
ncbi:zinc metalloprotease [Porphyromonas pasteri]|uniref:Zinc metalloprotease n=2 Tax=Porphyromonas pasteri TaxID=1583331 RepID=A0ABQ2H7E8_9PORP|nr:zinc metalloprotease [Porphyromonas pasteri]